MKNKKEPNKLKGYKGLKRLFPYYKKNSRSFSLLILIMLVTPVTGMLSPIFTANSIASLTEGAYNTALYFACLLLMVKLITYVMGYFNNLLYIKIDNNVLFDLKKDLISSITSVTMSKHDKTNSGKYIDRISEDVYRCSDVLLDVIQVFVDLITNLGFLIYIAFLNFWFFLLMLSYVLVLWCFDIKTENIWFKLRKKFKEAREIVTGTYAEQIRGIRDVRSLNIRKNTIFDSAKKESVTLNIYKKSYSTRAGWKVAKYACAAIFEVGFIVLGILFVQAGYITLAGFFVVYLYHTNVKMVSQYVASIKQYSAEGELAAQRIFEIIDVFPKEHFGNQIIENLTGKVEFINVSFEYENNQTILSNVNLNFEPFKSTAIVGKSGSGKSTILSLINKIYNIQEGEILLDGLNINQLTEDSLRDNVGTVTQNPYIFNRTIRENLLLINPNATEEEIIKVLKQAQIYDFVESLEKGIDSMVGENGVILSGGQKQRLAIARLLLKNTKVIILDEATSSLDNENQNKIVDVIENLKVDHTIIIVAHRLSTIVNADKIIVLDKGKVINQGKHKYLIENCKEYKELYKIEESISKYEILNKEAS